MITTIVVLVALLVVVAVSLLFVFHHEYELGAIGAAGLCLLALAAMSRLELLVERLLKDGTNIADPSPRVLLLWTGLALFLGQLAWRFLCRYRARDESWRSPHKQL